MSHLLVGYQTPAVRQVFDMGRVVANMNGGRFKKRIVAYLYPNGPELSLGVKVVVKTY